MIRICLVVLALCLSLCKGLTERHVGPGSIMSTYFTNEEMELFLKNFAESEECGSISRLFSIGKSEQGLNLWVLELSNNPGVEEAKPNYKYVANMHGNEPGGRQLLLQLAQWICENWKTDPKASKIISEMHLYLMPSLNPDGFALKQRENSNGVDLNRDFPERLFFPDGNLRLSGDEAAETLAMIEWLETTSFVGSGNLHEGALVANYPWDALDEGDTPGYAACPDDATFIYLAETYSDAHSTMYLSTEFEGGIINGNDWYPVHGGMQDLNYYKYNVMELTLELSDVKYVDESKLPNQWEENKESLIALPIATVFDGLMGVVECEEGTPLNATISVHGIKKNYYTNPKFGDFYRPLAPGTYTVSISSEGYVTQTKEITVPLKEYPESFRLKRLEPALRVVNSKSFNAEQPSRGHSWTSPFLIFVCSTALVCFFVQRNLKRPRAKSYP